MTVDQAEPPIQGSAHRVNRLSSIRLLINMYDDKYDLVTRGFYLYTALLILFLWTPLAVVIFLSFAENPNSIFPFEGFTIRYFVGDWAGSISGTSSAELINRLIRTGMTSVHVATTAASLATVLGVLASFGVVRNRFAFRRLFVTVSILPMIIPGVVFGAGFFLLFNTFVEQSTGFWPLVIAHTAYGFPFVFLAVTSRLVTFDTALEECARDLGASIPEAFRDVTFPIIRPAIIAGFLFAWIRSLEDFTRALFISGQMNVLTTDMFSLISFGRIVPMNVVSTLLLFLAGAVIIIVMSLGRAERAVVKR